MATSCPAETELEVAEDLYGFGYDGLILVSTPDAYKKMCGDLPTVIDCALALDSSLLTDPTTIGLPSKYKAKRMVFSCTGPVDPDYDDSRVLRLAANNAIKKAIKTGIRKPLLILLDHPQFKNSQLIILLGALEALYVPLQILEHDPCKLHSIKSMGIYTIDPVKTEKLLCTARVLESGRRVACDIGEPDPERMTPSNVEDYTKKLFADSLVSVSVIKDLKEIAKDYPLFEAVNRCASTVERHQGRIVFLEYNPAGAKRSVFIVGKGVTYDTGGADLKVGGVMAGMSRDKCGAAAAIGFMHVVRLLQPKDLRVMVGVGLVRNSVGSNAYVADELIKSRSGALVRVGNTDAEGRMIMADVLCRMKEMATCAKDPHIYTIATLTGHAVLTVGTGYSIVLDNGPARNDNHAQKLQKAGDEIADPFEISTIRREDLAFHKGKSPGDDVIQCNNSPSSRTSRGHQGPAGFLMLASGLDKHGSGSKEPLKYSHLDIAASAGDPPDPTTGAPVLALAKAYLLDECE